VAEDIAEVVYSETAFSSARAWSIANPVGAFEEPTHRCGAGAPGRNPPKAGFLAGSRIRD